MAYPPIYSLGDEPRGWKTQAEKTCRAILGRTPAGTELSPDDAAWLRELLVTRHNWRQQIADEAVSWWCQYDDLGFLRFEYHTGSNYVAVSWKKAISPPDLRRVALSSMRKAVQEQISNFKQAHYQGAKCEICQAPFLSSYTAHADHSSPTYIELATAFADESGGWDKLLNRDETLVDLGGWLRYHHRHAKLRMVCAECNLGKLVVLFTLRLVAGMII